MASGKAEVLRLSLDRVEYWVNNGAQVSDTVTRLLRQAKTQAAAA